jgi:hypothetical protein
LVHSHWYFFTKDYLDDWLALVQMLDVAQAGCVVCMVFLQKEIMGMLTVVFFGDE